jgi:hypothetical protein
MQGAVWNQDFSPVVFEEGKREVVPGLDITLSLNGYNPV